MSHIIDTGDYTGSCQIIVNLNCVSGNPNLRELNHYRVKTFLDSSFYCFIVF